MTTPSSLRATAAPEHPLSVTLPHPDRDHDSRGFDSPEEFSRRVSPLLPRLLRAARSVLDCEDLAWDAVQETLLRIWNRGWLPDDPGPALVHLVRRSSLHLLRCRRRRRFHEHEAVQRRTPCCPEDPSIALEGDEHDRQVRACVERMAAEYREVLELFEFDGKSYAEIAEQLDLPVGTVRSRLHRARSLVREDLERSLSVA